MTEAAEDEFDEVVRQLDRVHQNVACKIQLLENVIHPEPTRGSLKVAYDVQIARRKSDLYGELVKAVTLLLVLKRLMNRALVDWRRTGRLEPIHSPSRAATIDRLHIEQDRLKTIIKSI